MNALILLLETGCEWSPTQWAEKNGVECLVSEQLVIEKQPEWLSIVRDQSVFYDFDDDELSVIKARMKNPGLFVIEWKGTALIKEFIAAIPFECNALVDNDHGLIAPINAVRNFPFDAWVTASELPGTRPFDG